MNQKTVEIPVDDQLAQLRAALLVANAQTSLLLITGNCSDIQKVRKLLDRANVLVRNLQSPSSLGRTQDFSRRITQVLKS